MNILDQYRKDNDLSYAEIGRRCKFSRSIVLRHCKGKCSLSGEAALRYHVKLGIPLKSLRPDLFEWGRTVADNAL